MRTLALLAALALIPTGAFALTSHSQHHAPAAPLGERKILSMTSPLRLHPWLTSSRTTLQTGTTPTAVATSGTVTPVPSATPVPTGTVPATPTYPDPVTLLQNTVAVYQLIRTAHFELVTDGEQTGVEKLHLDATGDVTCKGPALKGHVAATDTVEATNKVSKLSLNFVIIKKAAYEKGTGTKNKWKKTTTNSFSQLGISADNLLLCPSSSSSSGSSSGNNSQFKNLVNLGPSTFQGVAVWHIQAIEVSTDSSGQQVQGTLDLYVSQDHFLPYETVYSQTDQGVTLVQKQILTKFGEKVTVTAPKLPAAPKKTTAKKTTKPKKKKP